MLHPDELDITHREYDALLWTREMLVTERIHYAKHAFESKGNAFNMMEPGRITKCGTCACIGGWMAIHMAGLQPDAS
jgi:hypothetical protein